MKRIIPLVLVLCMLLAACGNKNTDGATVPTEDTKATETEAATTQPKETEKPTEPPVLYRHPLTGEPLDKPFTGRVYAISNGNSESSLPQHGIGQADIVHEILAEGSVTRLAVLYTNPEKVAAMGSVRSARTYLLDIGTAYNAIYNHCGTSIYADRFIRDNDVVHVDAMFHSEFYRDPARRNEGYDLEHTLFVHGEDLVSMAKEAGYDTKVPAGTTYGLEFSDKEVDLKGESAKQIVIYFEGEGYGKSTTMTYDAASGTYRGTQFSQDFIDGNTGELVEFKNVLVLKAETEVVDGEGHKMVDLDGEGEGYYACNGEIIPIIWHREGVDHPFTYTLTDGTPLKLGVGRSYIAFTPLSGEVIYE